MQKIIFSFCFLVALAFSATAFPFFPDRRVVPKTSASYLASHRNVLKSLFDSCKTTQKEIIFNDNNAPFYSCYSESLNGPEWTAHVRRPYFEPAGPKTNDNWKGTNNSLLIFGLLNHTKDPVFISPRLSIILISQLTLILVSVKFPRNFLE